MARYGERTRLNNLSINSSHVGAWFGISASVPGVPTTPSLDGLRVWIDANDNTTITASSSRVSAISNKASGYTSFVWSNATGGTQPLLVAGAQGGKQVMQFTNARSDVLSNSTSSPMASATTLTMFLVSKTTSTNNGYKFSIGSDTSPTSAPLWFQLNSKNYYETGSGGSSTTGTFTTANVANINYVNHVSGTSKDFRTYVGGSVVDSITGVAGVLSVGGPTSPVSSIGRGFGATPPPDMNFCEVLLYNKTLATDEILQNISYLTSKWGI
jgi:hypothetical protein